MKPYATITAVNDPSVGWYKARTNFGTVVTGVSLKGPDFPLALNQKVDVFEVGGAFGAFCAMGSYKSILTIPGSQRAAIFSANKAGAALGYIAYGVGNIKTLYTTGTVSAVGTGTLAVDGRFLPVSGVDSADFNIGDGVLISLQAKQPTVIGWWNTVPTTMIPDPEYYAIFIYRPFFTAAIRCSRFYYLDGMLTEEASETIYSTNPLAVSCAPVTRQTTDAQDYFYSIAYMRDSGGNVVETRWLKWNKATLDATIMTEAAWLAEAPADIGYSVTVDNKFWWSNAPEYVYCLQSDTIDGIKYRVFPAAFDNEGMWLPKKGQVYIAT